MYQAAFLCFRRFYEIRTTVLYRRPIGDLILLIIIMFRGSYPTRANKIFMWMCVDSFAAALVNLTTFYTVSFPERYPIFLCYLSNLSYLFLFNLTASIFLMYVDALTQLTAFRKPVRILFWGVTIAEAVLLLTSPVTHLIIYFDDQLNYVHGSLFFLFYVISFSIILLANLLFISTRKRFNLYQEIVITLFLLALLVGLVFQVYHPAIVITNFSCFLVLLFVYTAFENPAYYTFGSTRCYNLEAFNETVRNAFNSQRHLIVFSVHPQCPHESV